ncbi:hypothetical protein EJMLMN_EJMLMN_15610, partial [Dysosmobacter welbionis]
TFSGAKPLLAASRPMFTSSRMSCTSPRAAATFSISSSSSREPTDWIRATW